MDKDTERFVDDCIQELRNKGFTEEQITIQLEKATERARREVSRRQPLTDTEIHYLKNLIGRDQFEGDYENQSEDSSEKMVMDNFTNTLLDKLNFMERE